MTSREHARVRGSAAQRAHAHAGVQRRWFLNEQTSEVRHWYLMPSGVWPDVDGAGATEYLTQTVRFLVLLNALIPISLYVTLELVKVMQCGWIGEFLFIFVWAIILTSCFVYGSR